MKSFILFVLFSIIAAISCDSYIVVSHPFSGAGESYNGYEVLSYIDNTIKKTGFTFKMESSDDGKIVFVQKGQFGFVAQDNGTLGIFSLSASGKPTVIEANYAVKGCYASSVFADPAAEDTVYVMDEDRTGSVHMVTITTAGKVTDHGMLFNIRGPISLDFIPHSSSSSSSSPSANSPLALLTGMDGTVYLIDWSTKKVLTSVPAFADGALVSAAALTPDKLHLIVLDDDTVTGETRVGVVRVDVAQAKLTAVQVIPGISDPASIVMSPHNNAALVTDCQGNAIATYSYDAHNSTHPFASKGNLVVKGPAPQLPAVAVLAQAPSSIALVAELSGIRQVQFDSAGGVHDLGLFDIGEAMEDVLGTMGLQYATPQMG